MNASTGSLSSINIQQIPTNWLWLGTSEDGGHGGAGPLPGILTDPLADYIRDENNQNILPD